MLLTDPLAPQLVATPFIACAACIVYALLRSATRSALLPLAGVLLYVSVFIYTTGFVSGIGLVEWGILEKVHELTAVLIFAVIWIAYRSFRPDIPALGPWALALHAAIICTALLTLPLTLLVGFYLAGYVLWFSATRQWSIAIRPFAAGVTAAVSLLVMSAINYHYTGFPSIELITQFWPYADLERVQRWGTMFEVLTTHMDKMVMIAATPAISWTRSAVRDVPAARSLVADHRRLRTGYNLRLRSKVTRAGVVNHLDVPAWSALGWFAAAVVVVAFFGGGLSQSASFFRMSTFSYAPMLCLALLCCYLAVPAGHTGKAGVRSEIFALSCITVVGVGAISILAPGAWTTTKENMKAMLIDGARLWDGRFSLKDGYQNLQESPGNCGAIYPGIVEAWRIAGRGTPIWSFHIASYRMLPDCEIGKERSERLSPSWPVVLFAPADEGIKVLKTEGLNYFFFSSELGGIENDPLPASPIFSPDEIATHLAVRWTDGTSYLLTWPDEKTTPIDQKFLKAYRAAVKPDGIIYKIPVFHLKQIAEYIDLHKNDLRPFALPWCTNCQRMPQINWAAMQ